MLSKTEDTNLDLQLEADMMAVADKMVNDRITEDKFETPIRHVHTKQSTSATSSVTTKNSTYTMMTSKVSNPLVLTQVTPAKQVKQQENKKNEKDVNPVNVTNSVAGGPKCMRAV